MNTSTTKELESQSAQADTTPLLQLDGVGKTFGSGHIAVEALKPVSLTIRRSELVAIMGPSGSGKSTLLSLSGALDEPTVGRVLVNGEDLATLSRKAISILRRRTIGYVFQEFNLMVGLTALENVQLPLELDGVAIREAKAESMAALERLEIADLADRYPDNLSGGEQQRVAIARAFVGPRTLLLADEPTGSLDSATGDVVMRMLREQCDEVRRGLMVTHDASHAAWADRVIFIKDGFVVSETGNDQSFGTST
ncbi:MAG: ABC transporter ATP-binding protein [Planctomycetaceae bacterium]